MLLTLTGALSANAQEAYCALEKTEKSNGELESLTATFYYDNQRSSRSETVNVPEDGGRILKIPQEISLPDYINVVFDSSFANYRPTNTYSWFYWLEARVKVSFSGWKNLNTSQVKNMSSMFYALGHYETNNGNMTCQVENLDLSHFDTSKVTDMRNMFNYVYLNDDLDISSFTINPGTLTGSMMSNSYYRSITLPATANNLADDAFLYSGSVYVPITLFCPEDITTDYSFITNPSFYANGESKGDSIEIKAYRISEGIVREANISEGEGYNGTSCYKEQSDVDVNGPKAWDSQFFVYTPDHYWHEGDRYTFKMRVRANQAASLSVQAHGEPRAYQWYQMLDGNYEITTEWQEIVYKGTITAKQAGIEQGNNSMQTIAFFLNFNNEGNRNGDIVFYFDDISWEPDNDPYFYANGESKGDSIEIKAYRISEGIVREANISEGEGYEGTSCYKEQSDVDVVSEDGPKAWDSQLFVYTPDHYWHEGDRYTFKMRVRANQAASLSVQAHGEPRAYQHWSMVDGTYNITTEWQEIVYKGTITADQAGIQVGKNSMQTITFLLNYQNEGNGDIVFYFDDISWEPDYGQSEIFVWKNGTFRKGGQPYVVYRTDDNSMTFYCDDNRPAESETLKVYDLNTIDKYGSSGYPEWYSAEVNGNSVKSSVKTVIFDKSFSYYRPITCNNWFSQMVSLTDIQNIQYLNTDKVKDMSYMFRECSSLTSLDVSNFDTKNVEKMDVMFYHCNKLTNLDVSHFDTSKVKSMVSMFNYCTQLDSIDVSNFDTRNVTNMGFMFSQCLRLRSIDVSHFDTRNATGMMHMFYQCSSLKSLDLSNFTFVEDGGNYSNFLKYCTNLKMLTVPATSNYLSNDAFTNVGTASSPCVLSCPADFSPSNATYYETYMTWNGGFFAYYPYVQLDENITDEGTGDGLTLTFYCDSHFNQRPGTAYPLNAVGENPGWYGNQDVKKVVFDESFSRARPDNTYHWFALLANLKTIDNIMYLNTSNVTSMAGMFMLCPALESLYLGYFDTSNVTDMSDMFNACIRLSFLYLPNFDTSNVTNMNRMFADCRKLSSLDLRHFVLNNTSTERMMYRCYGLRDLSVPETGESFDASACEEVGTPEKPCALIVPWLTQLTSKENHGSYFNWKKGCFTDTYPYAVLADKLALSFYYDNQSASRYGEVFALNYGDEAPGWTNDYENIRQVRYVTFDSSFANARPTSTNSWFYNMINLESITSIEYLNTEEVTNMNFMFASTYGLKDLDLSHFNTSKVKQMVMMFYLSGLESIDVSNFDTSNLENAIMMFDQCSNLKKLDLSHFTFKEGTNTWWLLANCSSLKKLTVPSTANLMDTDACYGVGTADSPCQLNYPNDLTLEGKTPDNGCFKWKGGYFKDAPYVVLSTDEKTLTFYYDNAKESHGGTVYALNEGFNHPGWLNDVEFTKAVFDPSFADARPTSCYEWFSGKPALTNVEGLQYLDTSEANTLNYMFDYCINLQSLDLSHLTIPENTLCLLYECRNLKRLTIPLTASNLLDGACYGVGTIENPCVLIYPESMVWDRENYEGYFIWKGGYFREAGLAGDANEDGIVTVADVMLTVNKVLGKTLATFNEMNADVNSDGKITVSDVMGIVKIVLSGSGNSSAPSNAFFSFTDGMALTANGSELTLHLTGTGTYTATQMTLTLPEGCHLESTQMVASRSNGHSVLTSDLGNGHYRLVVYGASGLPFGNASTDLLRLRVSGHHNGDVALSDIQVVDPLTATVLFSDVSGIATNIDGLSTDASSDGDWYTTQGQRVSTPTRGVYIRNGQKVVVR